jgi:2-dehydro-3-deoxyphosphogluconate aldolase/(4S)-4-hydroxy-2-oxoglutarate aldolase
MALERGMDTVKFFPAGACGGSFENQGTPWTLRRGEIRPTGGIGAANLAEWLAHPAIIACGGSWLVAKNLLADGDWKEVERLVAKRSRSPDEQKAPCRPRGF